MNKEKCTCKELFKEWFSQSGEYFGECCGHYDLIESLVDKFDQFKECSDKNCKHEVWE